MFGCGYGYSSSGFWSVSSYSYYVFKAKIGSSGMQSIKGFSLFTGSSFYCSNIQAPSDTEMYTNGIILDTGVA
jgi:hypothetical protein